MLAWYLSLAGPTAAQLINLVNFVTLLYKLKLALVLRYKVVLLDKKEYTQWLLVSSQIGLQEINKKHGLKQWSFLAN